MKIFAWLFMVFRPKIDMEVRWFLADFAPKGARPGSAPGAGVPNALSASEGQEIRRGAASGQIGRLDRRMRRVLGA